MYKDAWIICLTPIIGSFIVYGIAKWKKSYTGYFSLGISIINLFLSLKILYDITISTPSLPYQDIFRIYLIIIIAFISILFFFYSLEHIHEDINLGQYWFWINFYLGSIFILLLSNIGIEMVLAILMVYFSNLGLISFQYKKSDAISVIRIDIEGKYNRHCGIKAIITTIIAISFMEVIIILLEFATKNSLFRFTFESFYFQLLIGGFMIAYPFYFAIKIFPYVISSKSLMKDIYKILENQVILNPFYRFFLQSINKLGNLMESFHLSIDKLYHSIPHGINKLGNIMRKFHTSLDKFYNIFGCSVGKFGGVIRKFHSGKINLNLVYFVVCMFLSLFFIYIIIMVR